MANKQREFSRAQIAEARRLYEETSSSQKFIAASLGISVTTLKTRIAIWGWRRRSTQTATDRTADIASVQPAPSAAEQENVAVNPVDQTRPIIWQGNPCTGLSACPERSALIGKLWASVSRQIARIDAAHGEFVHRGAPNAGEAEGYAKLIATLARSLRELAALDASLQEKSQQDQAAHDISAGNNADALRDELAKRLAALETGAPQTIAGKPDAAGN